MFNNPRLQGKKTLVEKLAEVVDTLKKGGSASDPAHQLAAVLFLAKLLEEKSSQEKNSARSDSTQSLRCVGRKQHRHQATPLHPQAIRLPATHSPQPSLCTPRDKVLKFLVELLGSSSKDLVVSTLRFTHVLMQKYDWRVSFATEGGVKAILTTMQEFSSMALLQQVALAVSVCTSGVGGEWSLAVMTSHCVCVSVSQTLKVITGASKHDVRRVGGGLPLSDGDTQVMVEVFASIGSATPPGAKGLLAAIPAAMELMLQTDG